MGGDNIIIGDDVNINSGVLLDANFSKIIIGNTVTFSPYSKIIASQYNPSEFVCSGNREHYGGDRNW